MSEMDMIERVAQALCDGKWDARSFMETDNGESPKEQRDYWRGKARTAIEAMMEPTIKMIDAAACAKITHPEKDNTLARHDRILTGHYRAMITAALSEGEGK